MFNTKESQEYIYPKLTVMQNVLLISESTVKANSELNDNIWGKYLLPSIRTAQDMYLQQIIGRNLYVTLLGLVDDGTILDTENEHWKTLLEDYIHPYLIERVQADIIPIVSAKVANLGSVHSKDEYVENLSVENAEKLQNMHIHKADFYCKRLQEFLVANAQTYGVDECTCNTLKANLQSAASTGIFLGGYRGRILR